MRRVLITPSLFAVMITLSAFQAHGLPVEWTLDNVSFDDGGTAFGSFVYDADANEYSSISVSTTAGTAFGGAGYIDEVHNLGMPFPGAGERREAGRA